jgi:transcriptional antiterminator RfaH
MRWYLLQSKPSGELHAKLNLERQGYEVYFPRLQQANWVAGQFIERIGALFPRYLFVRLDAGRQSFAPLRSTVGAVGLVRFGTRFACVPDEVIRELRDRADGQTGLHRLSRRTALVPGSAVHITAGPFGGLDAVFERKVGADRVVVLLTLLGHQARALVPARLISPAAAASPN